MNDPAADVRPIIVQVTVTVTALSTLSRKPGASRPRYPRFLAVTRKERRWTRYKRTCVKRRKVGSIPPTTTPSGGRQPKKGAP